MTLRRLTAVADPEFFIRGNRLTDLRRASSSHDSVIPYIISQIFSMKSGRLPPPLSLDPPMFSRGGFRGAGAPTFWEKNWLLI